jgi:hypothetical protein
VETGDAAAVVIAAASTFAVALLLWATVSLVSAVRQLRSVTAELRDRAIPAVAEARELVATADGDLDRMDSLLGAAEALSTTVDSASKLAYDTFSTPVIKAMALANGTGKAAKRLRQGSNPRRRTG